MSKKMRNEQMCLRKKLFWTAYKAQSRADKIAKKHGVQMRVYHCPYCYQYHLTSRV